MTFFIFFSFILFFGVVTSYEDILYGKIRNKYIVAAFLFAVLVNLLIFFGFIEDHFSQGYYMRLLVNVIIAFLLGFALWMIDLWTPGDAKLLSAYAILVPLTTYELGYVMHFPTFTLLSNTFVPLFFFIVLILPSSIRRSKKPIKELFNLKKVADKIIFLFGFLWLFDVLFSFLGIQLTFLMYLLLLITIPYIFQRIGLVSLNFVSILLSILRLTFDYEEVLTPEFLRFFIYLLLVFILVTSLINLSGFLDTTTEVCIGDLKPGMTLNEEIELDGKPISFPRGGITSNDVGLINKLYEDGKLGSDTLRVQQTLPFAPFLFAGVLLTYLCRGDLIVFLKNSLGF